MKTNAVILMIFALCLILTGCGEGPSCPTCSDEVSWDYYGEWVFLETGYDGRFSDSRNSLHIEYDCGWQIYKNRKGGLGDTYEVYSCDTGVIFQWIGTILRAVILSKGWEGSTKEGIKIGDDLSEFLNTYDYFEPCPRDSLCFRYDFEGDGVTRWISAYFSEDKKLYRLYIRKGY